MAINYRSRADGINKKVGRSGLPYSPHSTTMTKKNHTPNHNPYTKEAKHYA